MRCEGRSRAPRRRALAGPSPLVPRPSSLAPQCPSAIIVATNLAPSMPPVDRPLRLVLIAVLAVMAAALLWLALGVLHTAITLWQDLRALPGWAQAAVAIVSVAALAGLVWAGMALLGPRK